MNADNVPRTGKPNTARKSPGLAWLLSLVLPGSGQFYCGKTRRAAYTFIFFAVAAGYWLTARRAPPLGPQNPLLLGVALRTCFVLYGFAFLDAYFTAVEFNAGREPAPFTNPRVAAVLNLLTRGFGYWYLGEMKRGWIIFISLFLISGVAAGIEAGMARQMLGVTGEIILAGIALDAYSIGRRMGEGRRVSAPETLVMGLGLSAARSRETQAVVGERSAPLDPAGGLPAAVPLGAACLVALGYINLVLLGLILPNYSHIDQSRASIAIENGGDQVYRNPKYGIEVHIPSNWQYDNLDDHYFVQATSLGRACAIELVPEAASPFSDAESSASALARQIPLQNRSFKLVQRNLGSLGNLTGQEIVFSAHVKGVEVIQRYFLAERGLTLYALIATTLAGAEGICHDDIESIQGRLRILR